jgi:hypothetical protein
MTLSSFERRYQVFISSTYTDLQEERRAAMQAVLEMDCFPAGMELFPAADETAWEYIKKVIQESDYYVVVIGARYGSRDDSGLSFTEREYDYAAGLGKPVLAFLHADPMQLPMTRADLNEVDRAALDAFRAKVKRKLCDHWSTSAELRAKILASLNRLKKSHPQGGWVRAGDVPAAQLELELERSKRELAELRAELERANGEQTDERQLPAAKGWGKTTTLVYSLVDKDGAFTEQEHDVRWELIFCSVGPRLAESPMSSGVWRSRLARLIARTKEPPQGSKTVVEQFEADRVAWHLRGLGVIDLERGYWRLTPEGWSALDAFLVEAEETPNEDESEAP